MAFDNRRPDRVAEAIREEVATFLFDGAKDPRIRGLVTVTGVDVTRDLRHARVFVSVMGDDAERADTFVGLAGVASHLRGRIGRALRLRVAPEIEFKADDSVARAARIETLLEGLQRERDEKQVETEEQSDVEASAATEAPPATDTSRDEAR